MFCSKCGTELPDTAKFCGKCGASVSGDSNATTASQPIVDDTVVLNVKPTYKFVYKDLIPLIIWLLLFALPSGLAGGAIGFLVAAGIIGLFAAIKILFVKKQYKNYSYDFYKTKVCYKDSFLNISEKEVKYKYIREIVMRQTFIQRFFNIGTIIMFTNAETGYGNGIAIVDVENVQEVYKQIKSVINV